MSDAADRRVQALGEVIPYQWVRSKRRRHTHLVMDDVHGLQLRTPMWVQAGEADRLVATNASWALEVIARRARADADKQPLASGSRLPLLDRDIEVVIRPANKTRVSLRGDQLVVAGPEGRGCQHAHPPRPFEHQPASIRQVDRRRHSSAAA